MLITVDGVAFGGHFETGVKARARLRSLPHFTAVVWRSVTGMRAGGGVLRY